ncbi:hypothetical protein [Streptomyces sp. MW-W600-10]|uniref:hypothetical protein n=1 Tax=Streptomyces sp. MW-W600-10 TaxID=2829819 RepID=UPI001C47D5F9|nr:hypothetical protein [Streptomyces sp. MW-W600-10]MBV7244773.1 hypothetical protein [Streptomyces sp. MW-W600-10]
MTTTTAARAAVDPRPARGTAGRRAVRVGLLVVFLGGLLALGILAGGRAEAQERPDPGPLTSSVADAVPDAVPDVVPEGAASETAARKAVEPAIEPTAEPAAEPVLEPATEPVVEPAVDPVATAADRAAEQTADQTAQQRAAAQQGQQAVRESTAPTRVRDAAAVGAGDAGDAVERVAGEVRPLVPDLPGLPPLLSVLPVPGGGPDTPGAPSPSVPGTGRDAGDGTTEPGDAAVDTSDGSAEREAGRGIPAPFSGPATPAAPDGSGTPGAGHVQSPAPTPAQDRAPFDPCGDLARTATADVQGPRGGDLHAVPAPGGPHAALVRGAGLPATAAPIPDRSGEILEFPG